MTEERRRCPYCAEAILTQAINCKHCGRDVRVSVPPSAAAPPKGDSWWPLVIFIAAIIGVAGFGFYVWGSTSYSVDLDKARAVVASLEHDKIITERTCGPNQAVISVAAWRSLPDTESQENLMNALARICIAEDTGPEMTLVAPTGIVLARFNGRRIIR